MATWSEIEPLTKEHAEYLHALGARVPTLSRNNRRPTEAELHAAFAEIGAPSELLVDAYEEGADLKIRVRGDENAALKLLVALAKRCGQLYLFPFPGDQMPGVVADHADDLEQLLRR